jgi:hypothetical protein
MSFSACVTVAALFPGGTQYRPCIQSVTVDVIFFLIGQASMHLFVLVIKLE